MSVDKSLSHTFDLPIGAKVKSMINGLAGVITMRNHHVNGCDRYLVQPMWKKGEALQGGFWMDGSELKVVSAQEALTNGAVDFQYPLGAKVKSVLTGLTGIISARLDNFSGARFYSVVPAVGKDGKNIDSEWISEEEVYVIKFDVFKNRTAKSDPGGPATAGRSVSARIPR